MNPQEEEINPQEEKVNPQEEKMNLQEEKSSLSPGLPHVLKIGFGANWSPKIGQLLLAAHYSGFLLSQYQT